MDASSAAQSATAIVNRTLKVGSPADQMEALMASFRLSGDKESFVLALIGELVGLARKSR